MDDRSQPAFTSSVQPLLTPEEVARILSLTRLQVIRQSRAGRIPAVRIGKVWRYRPESIRAWRRMPDEKGIAFHLESECGGSCVARKKSVFVTH